MFGLGFWEIALILVAVLLVFGPKRLPELARNLGKGIREFRKATSELKGTIEEEAHEAPIPRRLEAEPAQILPPEPVSPAPPAQPEETESGSEEAKS